MKILLLLLAACANVFAHSLAAMSSMDKTLTIRDYRMASLLRRSPTKETSKQPENPVQRSQDVPSQSSPDRQESQSEPRTGAPASHPQRPWDNPYGTRDGAPFRWHARAGGPGYQGYIDNDARSSRSNSPGSRDQTQAKSLRSSDLHKSSHNPHPGEKH